MLIGLHPNTFGGRVDDNHRSNLISLLRFLWANKLIQLSHSDEGKINKARLY
jgi:hypothetical protein